MLIAIEFLRRCYCGLHCAGGSSRPVGVLYRSDASGSHRAANGSSASLATTGSEAEAVDDAVVAWLVAAGYPAAEAAQVLAAAGGDIDTAAERLFTVWTGGAPVLPQFLQFDW